MEINNDDNKLDDVNETDDEGREKGDEKEGVEYSEDSDGKWKWLSVALKVSLVIAVFFVVFYLIYYSTIYGRAKFVLSDNEIAGVYPDARQELTFKAQKRIYFYVEKENKNLESNLFMIQIELFENNSYKHYKQISYEVEKSFPKLSAYLPEEYFKREGKYRIKASLDNKIVDIKEIQVIR